MRPVLITPRALRTVAGTSDTMPPAYSKGLLAEEMIIALEELPRCLAAAGLPRATPRWSCAASNSATPAQYLEPIFF